MCFEKLLRSQSARLRHLVLPAIALLALGSRLSAQPEENHHESYRFDNGHWFDGQAFQPKTMYVVDGAFQSKAVVSPDTVIDLHGAFVLPPFADAHNHVLSDGQPWRQQIDDYLYQGIFYVKNPNCTYTLTQPARAQVNSPHSVDVSYSYGGLTASGGHPVQLYAAMAHQGSIKGLTEDNVEGEAYYVVNSTVDLHHVWPKVLSHQPDFIKIYLEHSEEFATRKDDSAYYGKRGLNPALIAPIVNRAHLAHLRVSAHVSTAHDFHVAVAAGVDEINHLPLQPIEPQDAQAAAKQGTVIVTTTLSHRPTGGIADLDALHTANLKLLRQAGVTIALGVDNNEHSVVDEAINVERLGVFSRAELLHLWTQATAATIFPGRKIGRFADGSEASFIVLQNNPLHDFTAVRSVTLRFKQGHILNVEKPQLAAKKQTIIDSVHNILMSKGIDAAIAAYRTLRDDPLFAHDLNEFQLNEYGYALVNHGVPESGEKIFLLNLEYYPKSANAWDSYADILTKAGRDAEAMVAYRKVLEYLPACQYYRADLLKQIEETAKTKLNTSGATAQ